ncbi:hypothetical protein EPO56_02475 [Patescibacteria group bacterium]|nr:MAG: hypothetical protein EPO56_02475 [Patescibacteria group bacterium]
MTKKLLIIHAASIFSNEYKENNPPLDSGARVITSAERGIHHSANLSQDLKIVEDTKIRRIARGRVTRE